MYTKVSYAEDVKEREEKTPLPKMYKKNGGKERKRKKSNFPNHERMTSQDNERMMPEPRN